MDHITILDIMQQFSITSTSLIIKMNIYFIKISQFFHQFHLLVWYKLGKEYIILDALSRLVTANNTIHNNEYFELDF